MGKNLTAKHTKYTKNYKANLLISAFGKWPKFTRSPKCIPVTFR